MNRQSNRITFSVLTGILLLSAALMLLISFQLGLLGTDVASGMTADSVALLP